MLELDEPRSFVGCQANARWVWSALCRRPRQVVAYVPSGTVRRTAPARCARATRPPPDCRCRAPRRDWWLAYAEVFPKRTHRSSGKGAGETCHVERWNCTLRQRLGRFVRKTLSFSKGGLLNNAAFNSDEATDDLYVAMFNGDFKFPVGPLKGKVYWDFAYNLDGSERSHHISTRAQSHRSATRSET